MDYARLPTAQYLWNDLSISRLELTEVVVDEQMNAQRAKRVLQNEFCENLKTSYQVRYR